MHLLYILYLTTMVSIFLYGRPKLASVLILLMVWQVKTTDAFAWMPW
jgi:hypothetical protein